MKKFFTVVFVMILLVSCGRRTTRPSEAAIGLTKESERVTVPVLQFCTRKTKISDVAKEPLFDGYGRLIFPTNSSYYSGDTLEELRLIILTLIKL